jgi:hypothetical protein
MPPNSNAAAIPPLADVDQDGGSASHALLAELTRAPDESLGIAKPGTRRLLVLPGRSLENGRPEDPFDARKEMPHVRGEGLVIDAHRVLPRNLAKGVREITQRAYARHRQARV